MHPQHSEGRMLDRMLVTSPCAAPPRTANVVAGKEFSECGFPAQFPMFAHI